ncbi:hypothetical protein EHS13_03450 [Paenibacillus psychroresistens]|uniref:CBM-cenC domain-containing protein n=1 Tax=Paenibacillus psychroresistens TaxID=1778678 RepID=A0A6B8REX9_9BACL|nr:carbohydrate binding domain-containing protein [Paenibacillus psychroresistens]QGQ94032.1 hypothetical protein EHS13_03450 [Paenibacillus psychroresistens]
MIRMTMFMSGRKILQVCFCGVLLALLCLVILKPSPVHAGDTIVNIPVTNSDFEEELVSGEIPGWDNFSGGYTNSGLTWTGTVKYSGLKSVKFLKTATGLPLGLESSQKTVTAGETYEASVKLNVASYTGSPSLRIRWYNSSGIYLSKEAIYSITPTLNVWQDVRVKGAAPYDAAFATIMVYSDASYTASAYVDEVMLYRVADYNSLLNYGFEEINGSVIPGWTNYNANGTVERSVAQHDTGVASLRIYDNSTVNSVGLFSQAIIAEPGKAYQAKARVKLISGSSQAYIKFYDAGGNEILSKSYAINNAPNWTSLINFYETAPATAATVRLLFYSSLGGTSETYWDNASLFMAGLEVSNAYNSPVSLGEATESASTQGGAISSANNEVYFVSSGNPGRFYAVNATTGVVNFSALVPNTTETWAVTVASNNKVYFSSTNTSNGKLWMYDPVSDAITVVGINPAPNSKFVWDLDADANGKIIGSTYSPEVADVGNPSIDDPDDGKIFEFNTSNNTFSSLINNGAMYSGENYVRGSAVTSSYVYAGIGAKKHLIRMDRATQAKVEIPLGVYHNGANITGSTDFVHNVWVNSGKLYVAHGTSFSIINESSPYNVLKFVDWQDPEAFDGKFAPPSPYNANLIYYRNKFTSTLWTYNASTNVVAEVLNASNLPITLPSFGLKAIDWVNADGVQKLAMLFSNTQTALYYPTTNALTVFQPVASVSGVNIQSLAKGPDNKLYLGGFIDGMSVFNETSQTYQVKQAAPFAPHQIEETGFLNGKTFFGAYGGGRIYRYDAGLAYNFKEDATGNPGLVYTVPNQDRPYGFASGDNKLFIGTVAGYQQLEGALTTYNATTDTWRTDTDIVYEQSIIALAYRNGIVYGSTSIDGGLGIPPVATTAVMFKWDAVNNVKLGESPLTINGLTNITLIGKLVFDSDGNLWGGAFGNTNYSSHTAFALFKMNPANYQILDSIVMYPDSPRASQWRGFYLNFGTDGKLYTTIGRYLTVFDPANLANNTKVVDKNVSLMAMGLNDDIYYTTGGTRLFKLPKQ